MRETVTSDGVTVRKGDFVEILDFHNSDERPTWVDDMNQYIGDICEIRAISDKGFVELEGWWFNQKWIKYATSGSHLCKISDISGIL